VPCRYRDYFNADNLIQISEPERVNNSPQHKYPGENGPAVSATSEYNIFAFLFEHWSS
jgi:hypothetical protein